MANHVRRQIREAVATAITGLATTSSRVFQSRVYPLETADLPGLLVRTVSESSLGLEIHAPQILERTLQLEVVAVARGIADLDDTLDGICKEVEIALGEPVAALEAIARSIGIILSGTEIEMVGTAEKPIGQAVLTYQVTYYTPANAPDDAR